MRSRGICFSSSLIGIAVFFAAWPPFCAAEVSERREGSGISEQEAWEALRSAAHRRKDAFVKEVRWQIGLLKIQLEQLQPWTADFGENAKTALLQFKESGSSQWEQIKAAEATQRGMQDLDQKMRIARRRFNELQQAGDEQWEQIKQNIDAAIEEARVACQAVVAGIRS